LGDFFIFRENNAMSQLTLFEKEELISKDNRSKPKQLLKWIGNKQRFAGQITSYFPAKYNCYIEPFAGSAAVLGVLGPRNALAGDTLESLIGIWKAIQDDPASIVLHYKRLWERYVKNPKRVYTESLCRYNENPNPYDLLFLCRTCYGGIVRFTKQGTMSTPIGPHRAIPPVALSDRVFVWRERIKNTVSCRQCQE
jgi:DNA adenine methylase